MPQLIAIKGFTYGGKALVAGGEFAASRQDARALVAVRHARYATTATEAPETKAQQPAPVQETEQQPATPKRGRPRKA